MMSDINPEEIPTITLKELLRQIEQARSDERAKWEKELKRYEDEEMGVASDCHAHCEAAAKEAYAKGKEERSAELHKEWHDEGYKKGQAELIEKLTSKDATNAAFNAYCNDKTPCDMDVQLAGKWSVETIINAAIKKASENLMDALKEVDACDCRDCCGTFRDSYCKEAKEAETPKDDTVVETAEKSAPAKSYCGCQCGGCRGCEGMESADAKFEFRLGHCLKCNQMTNHLYDEKTGELICQKCKPTRE